MLYCYENFSGASTYSCMSFRTFYAVLLSGGNKFGPDFHAGCALLSCIHIIFLYMHHLLRFFLFRWDFRYSSSLIWNPNNFHLLMKKEILIGQEGLGILYLLVTKLGNQSHCLRNWYVKHLSSLPPQ